MSEAPIDLDTYARTRNLSGPAEDGTIHLPGWVPLFGSGETQLMHHVMAGELAPGVRGVLGLFHWTSRDDNGIPQHYYDTVAAAEAPRRPLERLLCNRHIRGGGGRLLQVWRAGEGLPGSSRRVQFESTALNARYDIVVPEEHDEGHLRQVFEPSFIDWLVEEAPEGFAFQIYDGALCGHLDGQQLAPETLDGLSAATATVARRLKQEGNE